MREAIQDKVRMAVLVAAVEGRSVASHGCGRQGMCSVCCPCLCPLLQINAWFITNRNPQTGGWLFAELAACTCPHASVHARPRPPLPSPPPPRDCMFDTHTGEYPDLPAAEAGGSKVILNPPLPTIQQLLDANAAAAAAGGSKGKGKGAGAKAASASQQQQGRPASSPAKASSGKQAGGKGGKAGEAS